MSLHGFISGRLGAKPVARQAGDSQVCTLRVATNKKTRDGDQTLWVTVELWGQQCDYATRFLEKGAFVVCHGDIWAETYQKKNEPGEGFSIVFKNARVESVRETQQKAAPVQIQQNFQSDSPHQAAMGQPAQQLANAFQGQALVPDSDIPF